MGPTTRRRGRRPVAQLKELDELREQGILTEEEFAAEKKKLPIASGGAERWRAVPQAERRHDLEDAVRERRGADPHHE